MRADCVRRAALPLLRHLLFRCCAEGVRPSGHLHARTAYGHLRRELVCAHPHVFRKLDAWAVHMNRVPGLQAADKTRLVVSMAGESQRVPCQLPDFASRAPRAI